MSLSGSTIADPQATWLATLDVVRRLESSPIRCAPSLDRTWRSRIPRASSFTEGARRASAARWPAAPFFFGAEQAPRVAFCAFALGAPRLQPLLRTLRESSATSAACTARVRWSLRSTRSCAASAARSFRAVRHRSTSPAPGVRTAQVPPDIERWRRRPFETPSHRADRRLPTDRRIRCSAWPGIAVVNRSYPTRRPWPSSSIITPNPSEWPSRSESRCRDR